MEPWLPPPLAQQAPWDPPGSGPSRLPVSACPVPAPARRSPTVLPSPAPRPLSSSLDSAWGFAGFWEIKTASNSRGAPPGQTGPGGPCAPGYRPRPGRPGRGGGPTSRHPDSGDGPRLPKWGAHVRNPGQGPGAASVSCPRSREGRSRPPAKLSEPPRLWVTVTVSPGPPRPLAKLVESALGLDFSLPRLCCETHSTNVK